MSIMCASDRRQFASVVNLAAPLRTVVEIADELPCNARTYGGNNPAKVGLFMLGMSESRRLASGLVVPPREFAQAVERIGSSCRTANFAPIFVGMPPVDESRTFDFGKERVNQVIFHSDNDAFEFDNIAAGAVPEPATWAMLIAGFGLVGASMRRRKKNIVTA